MGGMNYHRNTQPHPAKLGYGTIDRTKPVEWRFPWESDSPVPGVSSSRGPEAASTEQLQRLHALGVKEDDRPLTRVQASFVLSALQLLEVSGINVKLIAGTDRIADPQARRRTLCRVRSTVNECARQANMVMATARSSDRDVARAKAVVATALSTLRAMIDGRLAAPTPYTTA